VTFIVTGTFDPSATGSIDNTASIAAPAGNDSATDSDTALPAEIFSDGFESGETTAWSSTVQ
jgi:hypothetical protein